MFNQSTSYLFITSNDTNPVNCVELFTSETNNPSQYNYCENFCKIFCLGYLQGNDKPKAKNSPSEFE